MAAITGALIVAACERSDSAPDGLNTDIDESPNAAEPVLDSGNISPETQPEEPDSEVADPFDRLPVRIGHDGLDFDACAAIGEVTGLNPRGDNFLSVRATPNAGAAELDRLDPSQTVWMCDMAENGWHGIVYDAGTGAGACGVSSPVDEEQDYSGPCRSGWVSPRYITLIAG